MTPANRLWAIAALIVLSAAYALLVKKDPSLAQVVALGYIAIILTILIITTCWKRPPHDPRK